LTNVFGRCLEEPRVELLENSVNLNGRPKLMDGSRQGERERGMNRANKIS
jgi:hypothetical protein